MTRAVLIAGAYQRLSDARQRRDAAVTASAVQYLRAVLALIHKES